MLKEDSQSNGRIGGCWHVSDSDQSRDLQQAVRSSGVMAPQTHGTASPVELATTYAASR